MPLNETSNLRPNAAETNRRGLRLGRIAFPQVVHRLQREKLLLLPSGSESMRIKAVATQFVVCEHGKHCYATSRGTERPQFRAAIVVHIKIEPQTILSGRAQGFADGHRCQAVVGMRVEQGVRTND